MSRRRTINPDAALQPISVASFQTGLSQKYIREGCRSGRIPHIRIGADYRIFMSAFLEMLAAESKGLTNGTMQTR